jgi:uncharacterized ion transporter superfamily protein YfcC
MPRSPGFGPLPYAPGMVWIAVIWVALCIAAVCIVIWYSRRNRRPP